MFHTIQPIQHHSLQRLIYNLLLLTFFLGVDSTAQASNERTDFAQSYLGLGLQQLPALTMNNGAETQSSRMITRLSWGGLHFWRHVDFEITIPLAGSISTSNLGRKSYFEAGSTYGFSTNIYPWSLEAYSLRPFVGVGFFSGLYFKGGSEFEEATTFSRNFSPLKVGISYRTENIMLEAGIQKIPLSSFNYYTSRTDQAQVRFSSESFYTTAKYVYEGSAGAKDENLGSGALTLAIGPSSSYGLTELDYNSSNRPWVSNKPFQSDLMVEYGLGYFFFDSEIQVNLAFKTAQSQVNGYTLKQNFVRESRTLELYKYLFDYHGFTPYLGPNFNFDTFRFAESDNAVQTIDDHESLNSMGMTFGWDIKPVKKMKTILRTNLRWTFPTKKLFSDKSYEMNAQQFEFNYIQLVFLI